VSFGDAEFDLAVCDQSAVSCADLDRTVSEPAETSAMWASCHSPNAGPRDHLVHGLKGGKRFVSRVGLILPPPLPCHRSDRRGPPALLPWRLA
jgi:hypothetical protein